MRGRDASWQLNKFGYLNHIRVIYFEYNDTVGALRDTMIVRYGTMCNLRYVDKVADKIALSHLILNPFGVLMQLSLKQKSTIR